MKTPFGGATQFTLFGSSASLPYTNDRSVVFKITVGQVNLFVRVSKRHSHVEHEPKLTEGFKSVSVHVIYQL